MDFKQKQARVGLGADKRPGAQLKNSQPKSPKPWLLEDQKDIFEVPPKVIANTKEWLPILTKYFEENVPKSKANNVDTNQLYIQFCKILNKCLNKTDSIYWTVLHLVNSSTDFATATSEKNSITSFLVRGFRDYLEGLVTKPNPLPQEIKKAALLLAIQQNHSTVIETIFALFDLSETSEVQKLKCIEDSIRTKRYDSAARAVAGFKLQRRYKIEDILFPLFLQKKFQPIEVYVADNTSLQVQLVCFFDQFFGGNDRINDLARRYRLSEDQKKVLRSNEMHKAVKNFARKFNVPLQYWPNVKRLHDKSTLHYFVSQYVQSAMDTEDFRDFVIEIAGNDQFLQESLIKSMAIAFKDVNGAAYFADKFKLPLSQIPDRVRTALQNRNCTLKKSLPLPAKILYSSSKMSIAKVENAEHFRIEMENILKKGKSTIVGIDCEWKPSRTFVAETVALLQVATNDTDVVLVIDIHNMKQDLTDRHWSSFKNLLLNENILKLGFSFHNDLNALANTSTLLKDKLTNNFLDMRFLCNNILDEHPAIFPYYDGTAPTTRGLDSYAKLCCGKSLDKTQQMVNWERRPLEDYKLYYAGADAYLLVEMYHILKTRATKMGIDLEPFLSLSKMKEEN